MTDLVAAAARVPCSTSNLGSGYDTIGLALDRFLEASFEPDERGELTVVRTGTLRRLDEQGASDLVAEAMMKTLGPREGPLSGTLTIDSSIPVARGLGASAAARVAGFDLALAAQGHPRDDDATFAYALAAEGHGDNAAPSLLGGLRAVATTADGPVVMGLSLSPDVGFAYAAPAAGVSTDEARRLLPRNVPHKVAAASLGRLVALIRGLAEGNPDLIRIGVRDELHVPYRLPLIPSAMSAISAGVDAGAWTVTVSGAGSGLIAMCAPDDAATVAAAMREVFDSGVNDPECVGFAVRPSSAGLQRLWS